MSGPIAIVDPYSGGAVLASELRRRGIGAVWVQSTVEVPAAFRAPNRDDFVERIGHRPLEETLDRLRGLRTRAVVAGCDLGVGLTDRLNDGLGLPGNEAQTSEKRRNKFEMAEALRKQGVAIPEHGRARTVDEALHWAAEYGRWPVVLKPEASTASDGVSACASEDQVVEAFARIREAVNVLGETNEHVLIQGFVEGEEYVVDTVSLDGRHRLAALWRYDKSGRTGALSLGYDGMRVIEGEGELATRLFDRARSALDALGVRHGPAHSEIMEVEGELVIVEVGARLTAGINAWIPRLCGGASQVDLLIESYENPESFQARRNGYRRKQHAVNVFLKPPRPGILKATPRLSELRRLESLHDVSIGARRGEPLPEVAGRITLRHASESLIDADVARVREIEANGLFEVES